MEAGVLTELEKHSGKSFVKEDQRGLHIADPSLTWDFVDWLRTVTKLPVFLKVNSATSRLLKRTQRSSIRARGTIRPLEKLDAHIPVYQRWLYCFQACVEPSRTLQNISRTVCIGFRL